MKKHYLLFAAILFSCIASAQITITGSDFPVAGDAFATGTDTNSTVAITATAASAQTWNFTSLQNVFPDTFSYFNPALTPQGSAFPTSDMATYDRNSGIYAYMVHRSGGLFIQGISIDLSAAGFGVVNLKAAPEEKFIQDPTTYNTSFSGNYVYQATFNKNSNDLDTVVKHFVNKTVNADAFGAMTTTFGTFNTVRVHNYQITADTMYFTYFGFPFGNAPLGNDTTSTYTFLANSIGHPIVTINADASDSILSVEFLTGNQFQPTALFYGDSLTPQPGQMVNFSNLSSGSTSWTWSFGDGSTSNLLAPSHAYSSPGAYTVQLIAYNANGSDTLTRVDYITVPGPAGITESAKADKVKAYPNPVYDQLNFSFPEIGNNSVEIVDLTGKVIMKQSFTGNRGKLNTSGLKTGLYFYRSFNDNKQTVSTGKFNISK